jgi:hypothetical protein
MGLNPLVANLRDDFLEEEACTVSAGLGVVFLRVFV